MNKDIIYIDTEDDITAIIGKIKASKEKIVALVPPKRTGVLQSAVNLRLLSRMAEKNGKNLVLITNNKALIALSAPAKIPFARNLQSKPEIAEIAALEIDDGEDIIDGAQLPIGELAKTADYKSGEDVSDDISSINIDDEGPKYVVPSSKGLSKPLPSKSPAKSNIKVPNFSKFRKKLFLGIAAGVLLIIFLVWAIWFAPSAKVIITAKTEPAPASETVSLVAATDLGKNTIQSVTKQIKKDVSVDFTATGQKDIGAKASGSITIRNCDYPSGFTLSSGTSFTNSSGKVFSSLSAVSVPGFTGASSSCTLSGSASGKATVQVQALASGESYNNSGGSYTISSIPASSKVDAQGTAMTGGTTKIATIVTADDVQKASQALVDLPSSDIKKQLIKQFSSGEFVIDDSFNIDRAPAVSAPSIGAEAVGGKAKLTSSTTYLLTAISKSELQAFLKNSLNKQIGNDQRIYKDGIDNVKLSGYVKTDNGATVNINAIGQIGPKIDKEVIKNQVKGKHFGDVQSLIEGIKGVNNVDIKFSYFWVTTVPNDINKIEVEFVLTNA